MNALLAIPVSLLPMAVVVGTVLFIRRWRAAR